MNTPSIIVGYILFILFVLYSSLQPSPNALPVDVVPNQAAPAVTSTPVQVVTATPTPTILPVQHQNFRVNVQGEGEDD